MSEHKEYPCTQGGCGKVFSRPGRLLDHLNSHTNEQPYECEEVECKQTFTSYKNFKRHMNHVHMGNPEQKLRCEFEGCGKWLANRKSFNIHMEKVHIDPKPIARGSGIHVCSFEGCNRSFSKPSRLRDHMCSHTGERSHKCEVAGCSHSYQRAAHLKRHMESSHRKPGEDKDRIPCTQKGCSQTFANTTNLKKHVDSIHTMRYKCTVEGCGEKFHKKRQLKKHSLLHNMLCITERYTLRCDVDGCNKEFATKTKLECHQKGHAGFMCKEANCNQHFPKWTLFRKHLAMAHKTEHQCEKCGKNFKERSQYRAHVKTHGDRELIPCPQENCPRAYMHQRNLQAHIKSKHKGKKYHCSVEGCDREFSFKITLKKHMAMHDPKRPLPKKRPRKSTPKKISMESMSNFLVNSEAYNFPEPKRKPISVSGNLGSLSFTVINDRLKEPQDTVIFTHPIVVQSDSEDMSGITDASDTEKDKKITSISPSSVTCQSAIKYGPPVVASADCSTGRVPSGKDIGILTSKCPAVTMTDACSSGQVEAQTNLTSSDACESAAEDGTSVVPKKDCAQTICVQENASSTRTVNSSLPISINSNSVSMDPLNDSVMNVKTNMNDKTLAMNVSSSAARKSRITNGRVSSSVQVCKVSNKVSPGELLLSCEDTHADHRTTSGNSDKELSDVTSDTNNSEMSVPGSKLDSIVKRIRCRQESVRSISSEDDSDHFSVVNSCASKQSLWNTMTDILGYSPRNKTSRESDTVAMDCMESDTDVTDSDCTHLPDENANLSECQSSAKHDSPNRGPETAHVEDVDVNMTLLTSDNNESGNKNASGVNTEKSMYIRADDANIVSISEVQDQKDAGCENRPSADVT